MVIVDNIAATPPLRYIVGCTPRPLSTRERVVSPVHSHLILYNNISVYNSVKILFRTCQIAPSSSLRFSLSYTIDWANVHPHKPSLQIH